MRAWLLVCLLACKKQEVNARQVLTTLTEFTERMCACTTRTCGQRVSDAIYHWAQSTTAAKDGDHSLDAELEQTGRTLGECTTRGMSGKPAPDAAVLADVPDAPTTRTVDALARQARAWVAQHKPGRVLARMRASLVQRDGTLAARGALELEFARVRQEPPITRDDCFTLRTTGATWETTPHVCSETSGRSPACSFAAIWQRAADAPANALAVIEFAAAWTFAIETPRSTQQFADDCPFTVER